MIKVTVELIPGGVGAPRRLGEARIWNDLEDTLATNGRLGSYEFNIRGKTSRLLRTSVAGRRVRGFRRNKNVWYLVGEVLKEAGYV